MLQSEILIVEDDRDLAEIAIDYMEEKGFGCIRAESGEEAFEALYQHPIRLIILDINLPGMNGFQFIEKLRNETELPVIFISARTSDTDKVKGLMLGGDDYLSKPYSLAELYSRVLALLRRTYGYSVLKPLCFSDIIIDQKRKSVTKADSPLEMTSKMYELLAYLAAHPGEILTKERLFTEIWGYGSESTPSVLSVHIRWLREKIERDPSHPEHILTVYGKGYRFEEFQSRLEIMEKNS